MQFLLRYASSDAFLSGGQSADAPPYHGLRVADVPGDTPVDVAAVTAGHIAGKRVF